MLHCTKFNLSCLPACPILAKEPITICYSTPFMSHTPLHVCVLNETAALELFIEFLNFSGLLSVLCADTWHESQGRGNDPPSTWTPLDGSSFPLSPQLLFFSILRQSCLRPPHRINKPLCKDALSSLCQTMSISAQAVLVHKRGSYGQNQQSQTSRIF